MLRYSFLFLFSLLILLSCSEQQEKKIPGSFNSLQMLSHARAYPNNDIPSDGFYRAYEHHQKLVNNNSKSLVEAWEAKGPLNTTGRTLTLEVNPQDPNTIYAGSASGGLWRSRSLGAGVSWKYVETGFPVLGVSSIEFAPGDSTIMFIGTGEVYNYDITGNDGAFRATRGSYGIGILKSLDGGASWEKSLDWTYQNGTGVWMIEIAASNTDIVYAATTEGVYKSTDQGASWNLVLNEIMATDISINPNDENDIIAACGNFGSQGNGIYRSTDGGNSWRKKTVNVPASFNGKVLIDRSLSNPNVLYASIGNGFSGPDGMTWLLRSGDYGKSWEEVNNLDYSKWQGWFSHDVAINPNDPDEIIAVGIDIYKSVNGGEDLIQKSTGGVALGTPQTGVPDGGPTYSHSDHHFVKYHPDIDGLVLIANDGGCFLSFDNGETFGSYNGGMQTTQFYNGFSVADTDANLALGGLQDNSTSIYTGSSEWRRAIGGDGSWTAINQDNPSMIFSSYQYLNIARTLQGGQGSFQFLNIPFPNDEAPLFIAPFISSKDVSSTMYAGGRYLYRSDDAGVSWFIMNSGSILDGNAIYSMEGSPKNKDVLYVGTSPWLNATTNINPAVYVTKDGGVSWTSSGFDLPNRIPNDITTHPIDQGTAYVCFSGFGTNHLYVTKDFGETWTALDNDLPDAPGNAIIVDPENTDNLYYGNDLGVYFSADGGENWSVWMDGLPNAVIVMDLKISESDNAIWVATHGNGTYKRPLESPMVSTDNIIALDNPINIFPNPAKDYFDISIENFDGQTYNLFLYDLSGKLLMKKELRNAVSKIAADHLIPGEYILKIKNGSNKYQSILIKHD